jgi:cytochrome P450
MSCWNASIFLSFVWSGGPDTLLIWTAGAAVLLVSLILLLLWTKQRLTKQSLERCGLPTVLWKPRFINYDSDDWSNNDRSILRSIDVTLLQQQQIQQKLPSSAITNILPRMERLNGPFGMYGTVYGVSTAVVHVAHPVPTRAIFSATAVGSSSSQNVPTVSSSSPSQTQRRSSLIHVSNGASKAPAYDHFKNFCGEGVFTADGEDWKAKRASVMHCLVRGTATSEGAQRLEREANRAADTFIGQVEQLRLEQQKQQQQQPTFGKCSANSTTAPTCNVVPLLQRATIGLIYRYITHHEPDWGLEAKSSSPLKDNDDDGQSMETSSLSDGSLSSQEQEGGYADSATVRPEVEGTYTTTALLDAYLQSVTRIRMIILAQSRSIWFLVPRWFYRFFSSMYRDEERTVGPIRTFARQACENAAPGSPLALLRHMDSHQGGTQYQSIDGATKFSKDLLDEAITLLFAGQDTSAATLSWTLHLLSLYPKVQAKLAAEVISVLDELGIAKDNKDLFITKRIVAKLPYLDAVVKESMRFYPVAPFVVRRLLNDVTIVDVDSEKEGGSSLVTRTVLPAGALACIWIYGLHRNPKFWNRPNNFLPERWIDPDLKDLGPTAGAYLPFASGPRNCVGQPLAHVILRTLLTRLVHRYEFREERLGNGVGDLDATTLRKDMQAGFTVLPRGGVALTVHDRTEKLE